MSSPPMPKGGFDSSTFIPRVSRSVLSELEVYLRSVCRANESHHIAADPRDEVIAQAQTASGGAATADSGFVDPAQPDFPWCLVKAVPVPDVLPSPFELEAALRTVRYSAEIMADLKASALTSAEVEAFHGVIAILEGRIGTYERDFGALVEELRRAKLETEEFRQRSVFAETRLEALASAVGRMVMTMPKGVSAALVQEVDP